MRRGRAGNFSWGPFVGMFKWNDSISMLDGEGGGGGGCAFAQARRVATQCARLARVINWWRRVKGTSQGIRKEQMPTRSRASWPGSYSTHPTIHRAAAAVSVKSRKYQSTRSHRLDAVCLFVLDAQPPPPPQSAVFISADRLFPQIPDMICLSLRFFLFSTWPYGASMLTTWVCNAFHSWERERKGGEGDDGGWDGRREPFVSSMRLYKLIGDSSSWQARAPRL
jgi:hypothetical protein